MIPFRGIFALMFLVVGMLLAAGCTSSPPAPVTPSGNMSVSTTPTLPVTTNPPAATLAAVQCPQESNSSFTIVRGDPFSYQGPVPSEKMSEMRVWMLGKNSIVSGTIPVQQGKPFVIRLVQRSDNSDDKRYIPDSL